MNKSADAGELLKRCLDEGDVTVWESFVRLYSRLIWGTIHKTFNLYAFRYSKEDTEDIYSSVFLSLIEDDFRRFRQFRSENACSFSTWLSVIASRMTIDYMRRDKKHLIVEAKDEDRDILDIIPQGDPGVTEMIEEREDGDNFRKALKLLSPKDRMIYDLLYMKETTPEETADIMGLSISSIYTSRHRIIKKMKKIIEDM
jgi:RNA polymerase sigma factor (sigma-70 family)